MNQNPQPPAFPLEHEKLIAYREAISLFEMIETLGSLPGEFDLRDQLRRASASILLNIGEGASRFHPADKRRFYAIARGSLGEVGAALDLLRIRRRLSAPRHEELRTQFVRVARRLGGLCKVMWRNGCEGEGNGSRDVHRHRCSDSLAALSRSANDFTARQRARL